MVIPVVNRMRRTEAVAARRTEMEWVVRFIAGRHRGALPTQVARVVSTAAIAEQEFILGLKVRDISHDFVNQRLEALDQMKPILPILSERNDVFFTNWLSILQSSFPSIWSRFRVALLSLLLTHIVNVVPALLGFPNDDPIFQELSWVLEVR